MASTFNFQKFATLLLGIEGTLVPVFVKTTGSQNLAAVFLATEEEILAAFAPTTATAITPPTHTVSTTPTTPATSISTPSASSVPATEFSTPTPNPTTTTTTTTFTE